MRFIFTLVVSLIFASACTRKTDLPSKEETEIRVQVKSEAPGSTDKVEALYSLKEGACVLLWQVLATKSEGGLEVQLTNRSACDKSFEESASLHGKILDRILKDYQAPWIKSLSTGGLNSLQPNGSWRAALAKAAQASPDYQDYRKNYPNHKSQKSINDIFVELLLESQAHKPFKSILEKRGLKFEVKEVEKVLNSQSESGETVIHDAGVFWWRPN